jgi:hypothetical protein
MHYTLTETEKRFHRNLLWQCWRFACLSAKFHKLVREAGNQRPAKVEHMHKQHKDPHTPLAQGHQ